MSSGIKNPVDINDNVMHADWCTCWNESNQKNGQNLTEAATRQPNLSLLRCI